MASEWTTSTAHRGRLLELQLPATGPRRNGLESAIRQAIRDGRLVHGDSLPSTRALAADLGLARGTVVDAYQQLCAEGWLQTKLGAATMVTDIGETVSGHTTSERVERAARSARAAEPRPTDSSSETISRRPAAIDLRPRHPDLSAFPRRLWLAAVRHALQTAPDEALGNAEAQGRVELRSAIAHLLARTRGVVADPDRIVICSGYTQGLGLIASALRRRGATAMAMEDPCLRHHRDVVSSRGLAVSGIPVDAEGARTYLLHRAGVPAFVTTPSHQHPLGMVLSAQRRTSLLEWARQTGGLVIEDDYDSEFRYDRQSPGALQSRSPDHVIYGGTLSKTLASGLRLGWLVVPGHLVGAIVDEKRDADTATSPIDQLAFAHMVTSGEYERHVRKMRQAYRRRRDHLVGQLAAHVPAVRVEGLAAGLHAVLHLPEDGPTEADVADAAERAGVLIGTLGPSWHRPGKRRPVVLVSYAAPPAHAFEASVDRLMAVLRSALARP